MNSHKLNTEKIVLVTGASRSGKSEFAEMLAQKSDYSIVYVATAKIDETDPEWQRRIEQHQQRRPQTWQTVMISDEGLAAYIAQASSSQCLLIDSLGTWIANFLDQEPAQWEQTSELLLSNLKGSKAKIIVVGEETGWGVVPAYPVGRLFRDRLGYLSRQIANIADTTYLVAGGHVLNLSELGESLSNYEI